MSYLDQLKDEMSLGTPPAGEIIAIKAGSVPFVAPTPVSQKINTPPQTSLCSPTGKLQSAPKSLKKSGSVLSNSSEDFSLVNEPQCISECKHTSVEYISQKIPGWWILDWKKVLHEVSHTIHIGHEVCKACGKHFPLDNVEVTFDEPYYQTGNVLDFSSNKDADVTLSSITEPTETVLAETTTIQEKYHAEE